MDKKAKDKLVRSPTENGGGQDAQKDIHSRTGKDEKKGKTQERMERGSGKRSSSAGSEKMERVGERQEKMEGHCSTGQSPQWAVVPMEEEGYDILLCYRNLIVPKRVQSKNINFYYEKNSVFIEIRYMFRPKKSHGKILEKKKYDSFAS